MDRERAEAHLRLLAEAELRRVTAMPAGSIPDRWYSPSLTLVAQALTAAGAVSPAIADGIQDDIGLAVAARHRLLPRNPGRRRTRPAPRRTSWRIVPVGRAVEIRDGGLRREVPVVAYVQWAGGARFIVTEWPFGTYTVTAADDQGVSYQVRWRGEMASRELQLRPDPPHQIRWLGISGHGITAPPAADLPGPWHSMLTPPSRKPAAPPAPGILAATAAELPGPDGAQIAIAGLHHGERGTILHLLATGVTLEAGWPYGIRPLPPLWIRDSDGRWHTTRLHDVVSPWADRDANPWTDTRMIAAWLRIIPPLNPGTAWIEISAAGQSAHIRATLPLSPR